MSVVWTKSWFLFGDEVELVGLRPDQSILEVLETEAAK